MNYYSLSQLPAALGLLAAALLPGRVAAQAPDPTLTRVALIEVVAAQLPAYRAALQEETATSMRLEPGVLMLYAVADKKNPTHVTIMERYANEAAYQAHLKAPHFLKYKAAVQGMVKSLTLVDAAPIALEAKPGR